MSEDEDDEKQGEQDESLILRINTHILEILASMEPMSNMKSGSVN